MAEPDTIVAMATPAGRGAVSIVRVSGAEVPRLALTLLGFLPAPRLARTARFLDATGQGLDHGLAIYFPAPASFTGEHVLELQGHGGPVVGDLLLRRLLELGCRQARPGEFSERAFMNGKMDMAQAEAVADLIDAGTAAAARAAFRSLQGEFSQRVTALQAELTALRVHVEAAIDFPDEEVDWLSDAALVTRLERIFGAFDSLAETGRQGAMLREGLTVVIAGKPNAGKSSLLNALVGADVAIVTAAPGTTRDLLQHPVQLDGLPVLLTDTAGLRPAHDPAEVEGIRRARGAMQRADRVLYVVDATRPEDPAELAVELAADLAQLPAGVPVTLVFNKADLLPDTAAAGAPAPGIPPPVVGAPAAASDVARLWVSAKTGAGLEGLREHVKSAAGYAGADAGALSARRRHLDALARARSQVTAAAAALRDSRAFELFAEDLRLAQRALGEITGEFTSDDLLGEIFGSFCIGK
jgi:tRNA modification GTPase